MIAQHSDGHTRVPATARQIPKHTLALRDARGPGRVNPQALAQAVSLTATWSTTCATSVTRCSPSWSWPDELRRRT